MWRATVGDRPVYLFTWAASAIFSCGVRGVPGVPNTLKRVPELPNAHEGSSMACWARADVIPERSVMSMLIRFCVAVRFLAAYADQGVEGHCDGHMARREGAVILTRKTQHAFHAGRHIGVDGELVARHDPAHGNAAVRGLERRLGLRQAATG